MIDKKCKALLIAHARRIWHWSDNKREILKAARVSRGTYLCMSCKKFYGPKFVRVDHVEQVRPLDWDWNTFINRLFCDVSGLQVVCKSCHDVKSKLERKINADTRKNRMGRHKQS